MPGTALLGAVANMASQHQANNASFFNNLLQSATSVYNTHMTNKANRELAEYSYGKDLEQWNREVEYNTPLNQMKRYQEAGLNPNLIYSQGNPGNSSVTSPTYKAPHISYAYQAPRVKQMFDVLQTLTAYQNAAMMDSEIGLKKAQEQSAHAQASDFAASAALKAKQQAKTAYELELARKMEQNALKIQEYQMYRYQYDSELARLNQMEAQAAYDWRKKSGTLGRDWISDILNLVGMALPFTGHLLGANIIAKKPAPNVTKNINVQSDRAAYYNFPYPSLTGEGY